MSARKRRNIFQTPDERFNYRFGNPASRKRYRVRSKRRLIIAICVLLALLMAAGVAVYQFFLKDRDNASPAPSSDTTMEQQAAEQQEPQETTPEEPDDSEDAETAADSSNAPLAVLARQKTENEMPDAEGPKALLSTPHDTVKKLIKSRRSDWQLLLVNPWHLIPDDFTVETLTLLNGMEIDVRAADDLDAMIDDCFNAGCYPDIASAYRSHDYQQMLFEEEQYNWINEGYSEEEAYEKAAEAIAIPGTSEHECGLAVDIVDAEYQQTNENQEDTPTQKWLLEHSWEYGFVLRYPEDKSEITGIKYEPWHYRYVGKEYAKEMHEKNQCLEEFVWMTDHPEDTVEGTSE